MTYSLYTFGEILLAVTVLLLNDSYSLVVIFYALLKISWNIVCYALTAPPPQHNDNDLLLGISSALYKFNWNVEGCNCTPAGLSKLL